MQDEEAITIGSIVSIGRYEILYATAPYYDEKSKEELPLLKRYAESINAKLQTIQYYNLNSQKLDSIDYDRPARCKYCNR